MTYNPKIDRIFNFCIDKISEEKRWSPTLIAKLPKDKVYIIDKSKQGDIGITIMPSGVIVYAVSYIYQEIHFLIEFNLFEEIRMLTEKKD